MLKSAEGWDQVATFVPLPMHRKMETAQERQRRPLTAASQHPMPDLAIPPVFAVSNPAMEGEQDNQGWSTSETSGSQYNT